jgi:hypothetical protein
VLLGRFLILIVSGFTFLILFQNCGEFSFQSGMSNPYSKEDGCCEDGSGTDQNGDQNKERDDQERGLENPGLPDTDNPKQVDPPPLVESDPPVNRLYHSMYQQPTSFVLKPNSAGDYPRTSPVMGFKELNDPRGSYSGEQLGYLPPSLLYYPHQIQKKGSSFFAPHGDAVLLNSGFVNESISVYAFYNTYGSRWRVYLPKGTQYIYWRLQLPQTTSNFDSSSVLAVRFRQAPQLKLGLPPNQTFLQIRQDHPYTQVDDVLFNNKEIYSAGPYDGTIHVLSGALSKPLDRGGWLYVHQIHGISMRMMNPNISVVADIYKEEFLKLKWDDKGDPH